MFYDNLTYGGPLIVEQDPYKILADGEARHIHLLKGCIVHIRHQNQLAVSIINPNLPHILTLDVQQRVGWIRIHLQTRENDIVKAIVVHHVQHQMHQTVTTVSCGILEIVRVGAAVVRSEDEIVKVVFMFTHRRIIYIYMVCGRYGDVKHEQAVATVNRAKRI